MKAAALVIPAALALFLLSGLALSWGAIDTPEGDEETALCMETADEAGSDAPASACDDGGPFGYGLLSALFAFAGVALLLVGWD